MAGRQKDACVILVDVGRYMMAPFSHADGTQVTKADMAVRMAKNLLQHKLFFTPKHEVGLVFFGAVQTRNDLQQDGYHNVFVARAGRLDAPDVDALREFSTPVPGGAASDAVNGLIVALDMLIKKTNGQKYRKSINLLTDSRSVAEGDEDLLACSKQAEITATEINVTLLDDTPLATWPQLAEHTAQVRLLPLSALVRATSWCVRPVEQRAKVRLQLIVSPDMQIPVGIFSKTTRVGLPALKKRSKLARGGIGEQDRHDGVIMERTFHIADDPDGEEVKHEDMIKGHRYGQGIVPMSEYDEAALMYSCDRTLTALGFAPAASIGPEHSMGQIEAVAADRGDRWAYCALESLIAAMIAERRILIARYSFRKNAQPRMVALLPQQSSDRQASHLIMQYLPFEEDLREWTCASLPNPTPEQRDTVSMLLDAMTLDTPLSAKEPSGHNSEAIKPEEAHNPALTRFYNFLAHRAMKPDAKVAPVDPEAVPIFEPPTALIERARDVKLAERLKGAFGLRKVEKSGGRRKRFWREAIGEKLKESALGEVDTKKIKVDAFVKKGEKEKDEEEKVKAELHEGAMSSRGMAAPVVAATLPHISLLSPVHDFEQCLAGRHGGMDVVSAVIRQMCDVVERFVDEGEDCHGKALSCMTALRRGCLNEGEPAAYNGFLRKLRRASSSSSSTRMRMRFWEESIRGHAQLGLITDAEVSTSTITLEEAEHFMACKEFAPTRSSGGDTAAMLLSLNPSNPLSL